MLYKIYANLILKAIYNITKDNFTLLAFHLLNTAPYSNPLAMSSMHNAMAGTYNLRVARELRVCAKYVVNFSATLLLKLVISMALAIIIIRHVSHISNACFPSAVTHFVGRPFSCINFIIATVGLR